MSTALAESHPSLKLIVQDLKPVVLSANLAPEASSRIELMEYDFFTEQPVNNADVYFFRWISHNWSDKYCIQILRNQIPALKRKAKIVVVDNVLPEPGTLSLWQDRNFEEQVSHLSV